MNRGVVTQMDNHGPLIQRNAMSMPDQGSVAAALRAADLAYTEPGRAIRTAEGVLASTDEPESAAVAERAIGLAYCALARWDDGERHLRRAIAIGTSAGLDVRAAEARVSLSYLLALTQDAATALAEADAAVAVLDGGPGARARMQRALILTEAGRLAEAATGFEDALAVLGRAGGDDLLEGDIRTNRSILLVHLRDWRGAEDDLRRAETVFTAAGHVGRTAMVYHNRGLAAAVRGDVPGALAAYDEAARRYHAAGRLPGLLPVERAEVLLSVNLVGEAREAAAAAVERFAAQRNAVDIVQARLVLAQCALLEHDHRTAAREAERARRSAVAQRRHGWAVLCAYVALRARWESGDHGPAALRSARRTAAALAGAGWVVPALDARLIVARIAIEQGRSATARRVLADAGRARRSGPAEVRARAWHATALLRESDGDTRGADAALRAGMRVFERFRAGLGATELRAQVSSHAAEIARHGLRSAVASGRPAAVLAWAERWRAGALQFRPARPPDDAALAEHLARLRQVTLELGEAGSATDRDALVRRQAAIQEAIRGSARRASGIAASPTFPGVTALADTLGPATLVEYVDVGGLLYAVVLREGRLAAHSLGPVTAVDDELAALRFSLRRLAYDDATDAVRRVCADRAAALDDRLLRPLGLPDGPAVVVPTGALHSIPWAALPGMAGRPLSVAPSAALWHRAAGVAGSAAGAPVLVSGPGLPHAAAEIATLARRYPHARRFTGRSAGVDAVIGALDGAAFAHIAAHGRFRADNPLFSELRLWDGPLTVYDLERLGTPPRHVVLSSCDSGLPAVRPGDEVLGLAAALLALGTRSLVAAVMPVPDRVSRSVTVRFHALRRGGLGTAGALAVAQREAASPGALGFVCLGAG